jgi:curved DNA-binding protein CbpA
MTERTPEQLAQEREEAQQALDQILNTTRPRNLGEGLSTGVSNIVQGAVGAAGVAVILPTMGLAKGLQHGGLVGGAIGVAVGGVAGALGAAALAVGGAVSGVMQIGRGVAAVPESITAPRQGKWWDERAGKWVLSNMAEESKTIEGVPKDDSDILGKIQEEVDASAEFGASEEVKDMYYYNSLGIPASADGALIKRKYYLLARQYHPDRVGYDDIEAADKFKEIAEAYQVLSDPVLRKKYDEGGREALSADKTSASGGPSTMDPSLLFPFLFGSDKFFDYVGRLSTATSASVGDSPKISVGDARKLQKRRVTRMALFLIEKIDPWIKSGDAATIEAVWKAEAEELAKASFGYQMVTTIGKIYNVLAVTYEGSLDSGQGLPSLSKWAAKQRAALDKKHDAQKNQLEAMKATIDLMKIKAEFQEKLAQATIEEEKQEIA